MNRRNFISQLALGSAALTFLGQQARSQTTPPSPSGKPPVKPIKVNIEVSNNHGHSGIIAYEAVIVGDKLVIDIKGSSSHSHSVSLTEDDLTVLRRKRVVEVKSSVDGGHSHLIKITRDPIAT